MAINDEWRFDEDTRMWVKREKGYGGYKPVSEPVGKTSWWQRELDYVDGYDDTGYKGKSISSASRYVGGYSSYYDRTYSYGTEDSQINGKLEYVGAQIARLMNTIRNSRSAKDGSERSLSLRWADTQRSGNINSPEKDEVVLSPDMVVGRYGKTDKSEDPAVVDGLGGQALMAATLKKTMSTEAFDHAQGDPWKLKDHSRAIWQATETAVARADLLRNWPGAAGYIKRHQDLVLPTKEQVEAYIGANPRLMSAAALATSWKIANPRIPLTIPEEIDKASTEALTKMDIDAVSPNDRYVESKKVATWLRTMFEDDPPSGGGGGGGKGGGEGGGKEGTEDTDEDSDGDIPPSDKKSEKEKKKPSATDSTLFGEEIDTGHANTPDALDVDKSDSGDRPLIPPGCGKCTNARWHEPTDPMLDSPRVSYRQLCLQAAGITRAAYDALNFHREKPMGVDHGLISGDLDDGALHLLATRQHKPPVFERTVRLTQRDVCVGLLIDESGSMHELTKVQGINMHRWQSARLVAVGLHEAIKKLRNIHQVIVGHSQVQSDMYKGVTVEYPWPQSGVIDLYKYIDGTSETKSEGLVSIQRRGGNGDGYAIEHTLRLMDKLHGNSKTKILFVISDGQPAADMDGGCYGREPAMKHMLSVCQWGRARLGIKTYGIGIGGSPSHILGERMYGVGNFVCLQDVLSSARVIASFLASVTSRVR